MQTCSWLKSLTLWFWKQLANLAVLTQHWNASTGCTFNPTTIQRSSGTVHNHQQTSLCHNWLHWDIVCKELQHRIQDVHLSIHLCHYLGDPPWNWQIWVLRHFRKLQILVSDNASAYTSAARELWQLKSDHLKDVLGRQRVLQTKACSMVCHYGGWWECLIALTKMALQKVLGRSRVTLAALQMLKVEAILNNQPDIRLLWTKWP